MTDFYAIQLNSYRQAFLTKRGHRILFIKTFTKLSLSLANSMIPDQFQSWLASIHLRSSARSYFIVRNNSAAAPE